MGEKKIVYTAFISIIFYEFLQLFTGGFDCKDILASVFSTLLLLLFWNKIIAFVYTDDK